MKYYGITHETTDVELCDLAAEIARSARLNERKLRRELKALRDALRVERETAS